MLEIPAKNEIVSLEWLEEFCAENNLHDLWDKIKKNPHEKPFKSDGCSLWPDSWKNQNGEKVSIYGLCWVHDLFYWAGYPEKDNVKEQIERFVADANLVVGVVKITGNTELG